MNKTMSALGAGLVMIGALNGTARAQETLPEKPFLHPLFSENAVLQRDRLVPIWGWTAPGKSVTLKFDDTMQTIVAGDDGRWQAQIPAHTAGGPHKLVVAGAQRGEYATRDNLLFGDVWLCSGQSNMEFQVNGVNGAAEEKAGADFPNIRLLHIGNSIQNTPQSTFDNETWKIATPQTVGNFSAVGYFFGRKLNQDLKIPIGLIDSTWGGTVAEAWTSASGLKTMSDFAPAVEKMQQSAGDARPFAEKMDAWWQNEPGTKAHWETTDFADAGWKTLTLPAFWEANGLPDFDGVVWFRRTIDVPENWAGQDVKLNLGTVDDDDLTFWNGAPIGHTDRFQTPRNYTIPGAQVKAGRTTIAIRVLDTGGGGGFGGDANAMNLQLGNNTLPLNGPWKMQVGAALKDLPPSPLPPNNPNAPTVLYNGMIAPLLPGAIKGAIWYQGESNDGRAKQYQTLLPTLIRDWRDHFGTPLPFYIVQLANFRAPDDAPKDDKWAYLREAQSMTARDVPDTGIAIITDIGDAGDIHPKNKQDVGLRLALVALSQTYGEKIESSGPTLLSATPLNGTLQLKFAHAQDLNLKGDTARVFALAGADKQFHWATPEIMGDTITLQSAEVPKPLYARFGWSDNPRASLYNAAGLPASPFRTDTDAN